MKRIIFNTVLLCALQILCFLIEDNIFVIFYATNRIGYRVYKLKCFICIFISIKLRVQVQEFCQGFISLSLHLLWKICLTDYTFQFCLMSFLVIIVSQQFRYAFKCSSQTRHATGPSTIIIMENQNKSFVQFFYRPQEVITLDVWSIYLNQNRKNGIKYSKHVFELSTSTVI